MGETSPDNTIQATIGPRFIGGALQPVPAAVRAIATPIIEDLGLTLVGVEQGQEGHRSILWVYIDGPDQNGVTIDDCSRVSPELSAALDVDDPIQGTYELRVSSPGMDRPLMSDRDFRRFTGEEVQIQLLTPLGGRRRFTGIVLDTPDEAVNIRCGDGEHSVPLDVIQRARLRINQTMLKRKR